MMEKFGSIKFTSLLLLLFLLAHMAGTSAALGNDAASVSENKLVRTARHITTLFLENNFEAVVELFNPDMKKALSAKNLKANWNLASASTGDYKGMGLPKGGELGGYDIYEHYIYFSNHSLIQRTVFDKNGQVAGLFLRPGEFAASPSPETAPVLPEGVTEKEIQFESQPGYPLKGALTLPAGEVKAAAVLVHGSGPQDRDETIGPNKPLRDLAYGLASRGIAVLRYDKITFTYGSQISADPDFARLTVDQETVTDALNAVALFKKRGVVEPDKIFLLGHSLSGSLVAYINSKGADVAGYVIMAGTPRELWKVIYQQNLLVINDLLNNGEFNQAILSLAIVNIEASRACQMNKLDDNNLWQETIFTLPAGYLKHLAGIDASALHLADNKPVLVLWGGQDRQIYEDDYNAWKSALENHARAEFKKYEDLNHIFGRYQGEPVPFSELVGKEYQQHTPVEEDVIQDISDWILKQVQ